jgi:hypothetical protein
MEYLWDLYSVRITIEMAGGKLIFSALLLPGAPMKDRLGDQRRGGVNGSR